MSLAAHYGHTSVVSTLMPMEGVELDNISNKLQRTPLSYAAQKGYIDIVKPLLVTDCVDPNSKNQVKGPRTSRRNRVAGRECEAVRIAK